MVEKTNNIDDAEIKYKQALKNYHKESNRHVLVLEADVTEEQKRMILHTSNLIRIAGNCLATVMKRNYEQLVRTKRYRNLKSLYKKAKDTDDKKLLASVTAQIQEIQESYNVTWDFCRKEMNKIKDIYHINSIFARSKAEDVWSGIKKCLYGDGNTIHFKKYGDYPEIRAKEIKRGISVYPVVSDNGNNSLKLHIMKSEFNLTVNKPKHNKTRSGNIISDILEPHDRFAEDEVNAVCRYLENPDVIDKAAVDLYEKTGELLDSYRPCYVSLVIREIRGELRIFAHITIEGTAKTKFNKDGTRRHQYGKGFIGCDIGPQSIAYTSKEEEYRKKIYVNVLIVGAVILLYICINGKVQIEKGINMRHILELWNGYCNLIFYVKGNLFYLNEPLSDKTYIMHGTLSACLSWLMTGAGAVRYLNKYTEDPVNVVLSGRDVLFLINRGSSPSYNSVYTAQNFSALDFCKDVLEIFRENPKGWSEYTKGSNRTA